MNKILTLIMLISLYAGGSMVQAKSIPLPPVDDPVYMNGSKRNRAPNNWAKFDWEKKKGVLFCQ